jgi:phospholipid N-methyltransferase
MLRHVAVVGADVSEDLIASTIRVTIISDLGTTQAAKKVTAIVVPSSPILITAMKEAVSSPETPVLTRATGLNIPANAILQNYVNGGDIYLII